MAPLSFQDLFHNRKPVITSVHLPPFPGGGHPRSRSVADIERFALENVEVFATNGVDAVFLQELGAPGAPVAGPETAAVLAVVGTSVRRAFPELTLGVIIGSHGAEVPLAVARAIGAQFVRLKVYVGAMVKAGGIEQGCAYDAIHYRARIGAEDVAILADVYDRTGIPLGETTIEEASHWAVRNRADSLVLTGKDFQGSLDMLARVRAKHYGVPLLLGGSATAENVGEALEHADGIIVSTSLMRTTGTPAEREAHPWDANAVRRFVDAARKAGAGGG